MATRTLSRRHRFRTPLTSTRFAKRTDVSMFDHERHIHVAWAELVMYALQNVHARPMLKFVMNL